MSTSTLQIRGDTKLRRGMVKAGKNALSVSEAAAPLYVDRAEELKLLLRNPHIRALNYRY